MTRILFVTTAFPRWVGDHQAPFILELARFLVKSGISVTVLAMHSKGAKTQETITGVEIIRTRYLPEQLEVLRAIEGGLPLTWQKKPFRLVALLPFILLQTRNILKYARTSDILHAQWTLSAFLCWCSQWLHHKPYFVTVHGSDMDIALKSCIIRWATKQALNGAARIIGVSPSLGDKCIDLGVSPEKIVVIPNGVDTKMFHQGQQKRHREILFVGTLTRAKGVHDLISAMPFVWKVYPDFVLKIVGDGPERPALENQAETIDPVGRISFYGTESQPEVGNHMRSAKYLVLPSYHEGFGVAILEALSSGTPCIGTHVGGIPSILNNEIGRIVEPRQPEEISNALIEIEGTPGEYELMALNARKAAVEKFDWQLITNQFIRLYCSIPIPPEPNES